ncbi:MAG: carboxymuconolactone decarboxylase family protein [Deltaproteobacteria bacterium]|nr:carboxymuconolactone decarboxylase family protein [Deltaproteobacteria bacterium]
MEPELRALVTVRVSQINWCEFCVDLNSATAMARGASDGKLDALATFRDSPLFSARERAALELAEAMTYTGRRVEGEFLARLKAEFDDDALVELAALIAFQNLSSKFNSALDVPAQGFCRAPAAGR